MMLALKVNEEGYTANEEYHHAMMRYGSANLLAAMRGEPFFVHRPVKSFHNKNRARDAAKKARKVDYIRLDTPELGSPDYNPWTQSYRLTHALTDYIAYYTGGERSMILGRGRRGDLVNARAILIRLLVEAGCGYAEVGRRLGRDHSTIIHSFHHTFEAAMRKHEYRGLYERLTALRADWEAKNAQQAA